MGVMFFEADEVGTGTQAYNGLPESVKDAAVGTLRACGTTRYGNFSVEGVSDGGAEVFIKVQLGSGVTLDLSDRSVSEVRLGEEGSHYEVWHYHGMMGSGRVEKVHENGWVTLAVMGRY